MKILTHLAPSKVCDGVGVFALADIPQDYCIFTPHQIKQYSWSEINSEAHGLIRSLTYCDDDGFLLDCEPDRINQQYYINHSHNPNVHYDKLTGKLYAMRDIAKGEELLDYYTPCDRDF